MSCSKTSDGVGLIICLSAILSVNRWKDKYPNCNSIYISCPLKMFILQLFMAETVLPSKMFLLFLVLWELLLHNTVWFSSTCAAKEASFDITTDTSALLSFKDQLIATSDVNRKLSNYWTAATNTSDASVCHWIGVTCGTRHQRVVALDLGDMGLIGTIPSHLGNLSFLVFLNFSNNKFHGQLPEEMARLHRLSFIDVGLNDFGGNIPSWFGFLPQLKYLYLQNNSFTGPIPTSLSNCSKLEVLKISFNEVNGMIPQEIGKLHNLKDLLLSGNQLNGYIPRSIFNMSSLEAAYFAKNRISGTLPADICSSHPTLKILSVSRNEMEGRIPSNFQFCSQLEKLSLSYNKFHGSVPIGWGNLTMLNTLFLGGNNFEGQISIELASLINLKKLGLEFAGFNGSIPPIFNNMTCLEYLGLGMNNFGGTIPSEIGNCTSIRLVDISYNHLTGEIPRSIGTLRKIETLDLGENNLGGHVLDLFFNFTSLRVLALARNSFTGHLPPTLGFGLPNLEGLYLASNQFSGAIPDSISNASRLTIISINHNNFTGSPPSTLGDLKFLERLVIGQNNLILSGARFFASLNSCRDLYWLSISLTQLNGSLPSSFGNLTSSLQVFDAISCGIMGKIPQDIGNMSNLQALDLSSNQLVGSLPSMLQRLSHLQQFNASDNYLSGSIPDDICLIPNLGGLVLQTNRFSGPLPGCLGNITTLRYLHLADNKLSAKIPASLWTIKDILELDLSSNSFSCYLHPDIGTLRAATYINISGNQLSGTLPSVTESLQTLAYFCLADNQFEGIIPDSFGKMLSMVELDLSHNNLSGEIPKSLESLSLLKVLNLSFNQLSGKIPSGGPFRNLTYLSFFSNTALCGSSRFHVPQCHSNGSSNLAKQRKALLWTGITLVALAVLATLYVVLKHGMKHKIPYGDDQQPAIIRERISYYEVQRATNSFDESNLLGTGSFGSVYKGVFTDGRILAVKVFKLEVERAIRSFETECEILRGIRHRNLTKVISSCTNLDFIALVLEYMPNGSLERWLYSHNYILDFMQRLDIMIDVASALDYLHYGYSVPVVHCDLKPGNVLLDEDMVAHVSDFGIAKFVKEDGSIAQTNTLATVGYTAPEYGREGLVSTKCDVYSFGIMLMEIFTRRRPTDQMFNGDCDLKLWVKQSLPYRVMDVVDANLVRQEEHQVSEVMQCVSVILEVASNCCADSPEERTNMKDALASLKKAKQQFLSNVT